MSVSRIKDPPAKIKIPTLAQMAGRKRDGDDDKILSYEDVVLRRSDLRILRGPHFINDRLIQFYFAHLSATVAAGDDDDGGVLLVPPAISFLIPNFPDPTSLPETLSPLRLPNRDLILFTVNDNPDPAVAEGGSHWSLLAFHRRADEFVHHDSSLPLNHKVAKRLYEAVKGLVGVDGARFIEGPMPRQKHGYDCGLYVMAAARAICEWCKGRDVDVEGRWFQNLEMEAAKAGQMRRELLMLITDLMERQKRD